MENNRNLQFVLKHYREGAFNTSRAIERFRRETSRPSRGFIKYISAAAALVAVSICMYIFNMRPQPTFVAAADEIHTVYLPDGSKVVLTPYSTLEFDMRGFTRKSRSITMEGKAFFDVERDEKNPFEITTPDAYIKVLGTSFQVDATSNTEVYVKSGKVLFAQNNEAEGVILTKDMEAIINDPGTGPVIVPLTSPNPAAWATGLFEYESTPLRDVLKELSDFYGVSLTASDYDRSLTARFQTTDPLEDIIGMISTATETTIRK